MHESCTDWKGKGGVALWHSVPTSGDTKLIKQLVPEAEFSQNRQRFHEELLCGGIVAVNMTWTQQSMKTARDLLE